MGPRRWEPRRMREKWSRERAARRWWSPARGRERFTVITWGRPAPKTSAQRSPRRGARVRLEQFAAGNESLGADRVVPCRVGGTSTCGAGNPLLCRCSCTCPQVDQPPMRGRKLTTSARRSVSRNPGTCGRVPSLKQALGIRANFLDTTGTRPASPTTHPRTSDTSSPDRGARSGRNAEPQCRPGAPPPRSLGNGTPLCQGVGRSVAVMVRRSSSWSSRLRLTRSAGRRVSRAPGSGRGTLPWVVGGGRIVGADGSGLWPIRSADHWGSVSRAG